MTMQDIVHTIRRIARHEAQQRWIAALAVVKAVHGANGEASHACTVALRESGLVLPRVPIATGLIGSVALPRENDLVLVVFAEGDLHAPVVVGRLYSEEVAPPAHGPGEVVSVLPGDETDATKRIELRVNTPGDGSRQISLTLDGEPKVTLTIADGEILLAAGDARLRLAQSGGSDGAAEIKVGGNRVHVAQNGDVTLEAEGKLRLKAAQIEIVGDAAVKITGQSVDIN